jgi:LmbE family N-acetylglucosaminyl deacetylase
MMDRPSGIDGDRDGVVIERGVPGHPHEGRTLALVIPHLDDGPIFAGGTVAKLLAEGYRGFLIRTSNDEVDSAAMSAGETMLANERDARNVADVLGLDGVFDLNERNHRMDGIERLDLRARLIFLFRLLRVDTVFSYDPWGHDEENPDHYVTAQAVEAACWMAGGHLDYPEHFAGGLEPIAVREKYYFSRRRQAVNRVVDIDATWQAKKASITACRTMMLHAVADMRMMLADRSLRIPALDGPDDDAIEALVEGLHGERAAAIGRPYGLARAEEFHWIGPDQPMPMDPDPLAAFVAQNAEAATG